MGGNGKYRWRISFHRSNSSTKQPPKEFICPISGSLMSDPVTVASGQTFERCSVQVCHEFGYTPELLDGTRPDFSNLIPNMAIKTTILNWCECDHNHVDRPEPPDLASVEKNVRLLMEESKVDAGIRDSETPRPTSLAQIEVHFSKADRHRLCSLLCCLSSTIT